MALLQYAELFNICSCQQARWKKCISNASAHCLSTSLFGCAAVTPGTAQGPFLGKSAVLIKHSAITDLACSYLYQLNEYLDDFLLNVLYVLLSNKNRARKILLWYTNCCSVKQKHLVLFHNLTVSEFVPSWSVFFFFFLNTGTVIHSLLHFYKLNVVIRLPINNFFPI